MNSPARHQGYHGARALAVTLTALATLSCAGNRLVRPDDPRLAVMGRVDRPGGALRFGYPGVTLRLRFEGPSIAMRVGATSGVSRLGVLVDGGAPRVIRLAKGDSEVVLTAGLPPGVHDLEIVHRTETWQGVVTVRGLVLAPGGRLLPPAPWPERRLLFIGDSVTCGERVDRGPDCAAAAKIDTAGTSNAYLSYGMLLGRALDAQVALVCYGGRGLTRDWRGKKNLLNAPQLFEVAVPTDTRASRWDHAGYVPDLVVVSVGTNDFNLALGALPEREAFVVAYVDFVRAIRARAPNAQILLTEGAIVNDEVDPARPQKTILRAYIAETVRRLGDPRVQAVPATHYPGDACNEHPTAAQHAAMARDLESIIRAATGWR